MPERTDGADAGAVPFMDARIDDMLEKIKILPHLPLMYRDSPPDQSNFNANDIFAGSGSFNPIPKGLYQDCREIDYDVTGPYGISVADPGAVPGASTKFSLLADFIQRFFGGEIGSTRVVKIWSASGMAPSLSGQIR
jgi:hypothetical protein